MKKGIGEIIKEVKDAKSVGEKIRILQREDNRELRGNNIQFRRVIALLHDQTVDEKLGLSVLGSVFALKVFSPGQMTA